MADLVRLAPDVPDLAALGAARLEDFLEGCRGLATADRAEIVQAQGGYTRARVPLPGTPDGSGRRRELPRGAGTGWLVVHAWRDLPLASLRSRLSAPRSTSPAARRWNLACHLLAHGVVAPRPLALLERAQGLRTSAVLVEAELEGFEPLPRWLERARELQARRRGLRALALALAALFRSGVQLAGGSASDVLLADPEAAGGDCAAEQLARLQDDLSRWRARGLVRARLPAVAFCGLQHARLGRSPGARRRLAWLARLERDLPAPAQLAPRERLRLARGVLERPLDRSALRQACRARATVSDSRPS